MYVDLWGWFRDYEWQAMATGDSKRQRLVGLAREGWHYRELADGEKAIQAFEEAVQIAQSLNEACWFIFHQYWIAEMKFYLLHDYQGTLDYIVRLTTEARKAQYADCPVRSRVFFVLANIYYLLDFYGYEQEIMDLLDYIENEVAMDEDTHLRVLHMRAEVEFDHERYEIAEQKTQDMINRSPYNDFRQRSGYDMMRSIAYARGEVSLALQYNRIAQKYAYRIQIQRSIAEGKLWEAIYLKRLGNDSAAQECYFAAIAHYEQYKLPRELEYYDGIANFAEEDGRSEEALKYRQIVLPIVKAKPSILNQMTAYRQYLRHLGRLGHDFKEPMQEAKAIAMTSRKPEPHLERLKKIEDGNFYEYEWQKL
jgi:hypothetical protein